VIKKVLMVEDYEALQKTFQLALSQEGYEVLPASTCKEAIEKARAQKPDLVVLDMLLPDEGGMEFLRQYSLKEHPETKVIVFSNLSSPELFKEAEDLGACRYLAKSQVTPKELAAVIGEVLAAA
jgi:DNA-binding response OmpR family regulator